MKRLSLLWVVSSIVVIVFSFHSPNRMATADEGSDATIAALQTRVALQLTSIAKRDAKIDQLRTRVAELSQPEFDNTSWPFLSGTALDVLPDGNPGVLDVVASASLGSTVAVLVRNTTEQAIAGVKTSALATTSGGETIASGQFPSYLEPYVIQPGEYGIGEIYFNSGTEYLATSTFAFTFAVDETVDQPLITDLEVDSASFSDGSMTGEVINLGEQLVYGPITTKGLCFDQRGAIVGSFSGLDSIDQLEPNERTPLNLTDPNVACPLFLIASSGYASKS